MGVLNTLAGAAKRKLTGDEGRKNIKEFAKTAGARLARTAWDWSGANDVGILNDAANVSSRAYDYLKSSRSGDRQDDDGATKALPQRPNNRSQGIAPKPLALPAPSRQSNQEARATRQVSAETREKLRAASKANTEQRAATRQSNLAAMRERAERAEQLLIERQQLETQEKTEDTQVKIYDELEAIHLLMRREGNPLLNRPGAKKGEGGGLLSTVLGAAGSIPGIGGILGGAAAGGLGAKVLGKVGGLAAKVPGLAKIIPGIAGMAIPGLGGFAAGAATSAGGAAASTAGGGAAKAAGSLAAKVGDVTDVVAKPVAEKAGAKVAAKGLGKAVLKKIPLIGALAGIGFGISRAAKGDWTGAGLEVASGLAGTLPGLGTAASVGIDAGLAARDYAAEQEAAGGGVTPPPTSTSPPATPLPPPPPEKTGAERREAFAGGLMPTRQNDADLRGTRGENRVVPQIESSGASQTWRTAMRGDEDVRVIDLLATLTSAMLDRDKGIYVKPSKDVFSSDESPFQETTYKPPGDAAGQGLSRGQPEPAVLGGPVPTAKPSQVRVAPIDGAGFTPNSERPRAPRPFLGGGATPEPRQDISQAVAKDATVAIKAPAGPTVGVKMAGKGFKGFGDDVDSHIKEASQKYGISEDVLRGFVKMEGGWTGAMSPTGAIGTGQFIQSTWDGLAKTKEGQDIGMTKIGNRFRTENDPRRDKRTNTLATGLLAKQNADMLKANGLEATGENLYMMHNIGPGVIKAMKGEKVNDATLLAMKQNGMKDGMTPQDFVAYQKQRFNSHYAQANAPEVLASAKNSGVKSSPVAVADAKTKDSTPGVAPAVKRPASTSIEQNAMTLAASQREADAASQKQPVVVVAGNQGGQTQPRQASNAAGDSKPGVVVRNNESSLSRVTDSLIARTIT